MVGRLPPYAKIWGEKVESSGSPRFPRSYAEPPALLRPWMEKTLLRAAIGCCQGCPDRPRRKIGSSPEKGRRAYSSLASPPAPSRRAIRCVFPVSL
jgi:hypothetical protein